jgi:hypothetical protein
VFNFSLKCHLYCKCFVKAYWLVSSHDILLTTEFKQHLTITQIRMNKFCMLYCFCRAIVYLQILARSNLNLLLCHKGLEIPSISRRFCYCLLIFCNLMVKFGGATYVWNKAGTLELLTISSVLSVLFIQVLNVLVLDPLLFFHSVPTNLFSNFVI